MWRERERERVQHLRVYFSATPLFKSKQRCFSVYDARTTGSRGNEPTVGESGFDEHDGNTDREDHFFTQESSFE